MDNEQQLSLQTVTKPVFDKEKFRSVVTEWIELDDALKETNKQTRVLKKRRTELEEMIIDIMKNNGFEICNTGDGSLQFSVRKRISSINRSVISENLKEYLSPFADALSKHMNKSPDEIADEATEYIYSHRENIEKEVIKKLK